jgi:hypothetical protein
MEVSSDLFAQIKALRLFWKIFQCNFKKWKVNFVCDLRKQKKKDNSESVFFSKQIKQSDEPISTAFFRLASKICSFQMMLNSSFLWHSKIIVVTINWRLGVNWRYRRPLKKKNSHNPPHTQCIFDIDLKLHKQ